MTRGGDDTQAAARARRDRLGAALRENLRRRKAARRAQTGADGAQDDAAPAAQPQTDDDAAP